MDGNPQRFDVKLRVIYIDIFRYDINWKCAILFSFMLIRLHSLERWWWLSTLADSARIYVVTYIGNISRTRHRTGLKLSAFYVYSIISLLVDRFSVIELLSHLLLAPKLVKLALHWRTYARPQFALLYFYLSLDAWRLLAPETLAAAFFS